MPERATVAQGVQIGVESVEGTIVASNKKLTGLSIALAPNLTFEQGGPSGNKFDTYAFLTQNFTDVDLSDSALTYTDIVYALSAILGAPVITTPTNAVKARQWEWTPSVSAADTYKTFTVEQGDGTTNERAAGMVITDIDIDVARDAISLGGSGYARAMARGITMTATPTTVPLVVVAPTQASVYVDAPGTDVATWDAAFGVTKLTRAREAHFTMGGRRGQLWALDAAQSSYVASVELKPDASVELTMEADATGMGFLDNATNGDVRAIRLECVGPLIESVTPDYFYTLTLDFAGIITAGGGRSDDDGVMDTAWTFSVVADANWQKAMRARLITTLTAL